MGFDIKENTIFLEFYGLPGCGKSTVSHLVAEELRKQGKKVIEPTYDTDHRYSPSVRKGIKLLKFIRYVMLNPRKYKELSELITANEYGGTDVLSQAANIAPKLWEYDHAKADYIIFDEGLTQSAISLANNQSSSRENERKLYGLCKQRTVRKLYIKVSPEIALSRMAGRDKHDSRIEKIRDETEKVKAMREFEGLCESVTIDFIVDVATKEESIGRILIQIS